MLNQSYHVIARIDGMLTASQIPADAQARLLQLASAHGTPSVQVSDEQFAFFKFTPVLEGTNTNGQMFLDEDLRSSADEFTGQPIDLDHNLSISAIVGHLVQSEYVPRTAANGNVARIVVIGAVYKKAFPALAQVMEIGAQVGYIKVSMECKPERVIPQGGQVVRLAQPHWVGIGVTRFPAESRVEVNVMKNSERPALHAASQPPAWEARVTALMAEVVKEAQKYENDQMQPPKRQQLEDPPEMEPTSCPHCKEAGHPCPDSQMAAKLTTQERNKLPDSDFAYVKTNGDKKIRDFPIQDEAHARNALARLKNSNLSESEKAAVWNKIKARWGKTLDSLKDQQNPYTSKEATIMEKSEVQAAIQDALVAQAKVYDEKLSALVQKVADAEAKQVERAAAGEPDEDDKAKAAKAAAGEPDEDDKAKAAKKAASESLVLQKAEAALAKAEAIAQKMEAAEQKALEISQAEAAAALVQAEQDYKQVAKEKGIPEATALVQVEEAKKAGLSALKVATASLKSVASPRTNTLPGQYVNIGVQEQAEVALAAEPEKVALIENFAVMMASSLPIKR